MVMSDSPLEFDLKFLPDWLKEAPGANRYANYEGDTGNRDRGGDRRGGDSRGPRSDRPPGQGDRRGPRPPQGDRRGPRPGGPQGGRPGGPDGPRREGGGPPRRDDRRFDDRPREPRPAPTPRAQLRVDFLPEPLAATGIAKQIKSSGRAFGVFQTAKLFLERPERHTVRITSADQNVPLFQIGDGPISFDRAAVERGAFQEVRAEYYSEETVQGEPIKGNYTNVARCRSTGVFLGPTNYHAYQPALRRMFEERFSRRMSYQEFLSQEVEVLNNEQAVADWKEQARSKTTYSTVKEAEPVTFTSLADVEQHFRKTYLPTLVKSGTSLVCSGPASRAGLDRYVSGAVRDAWEAERPFPQQLVNNLRPYFVEAGLHFFKHRKRLLFVCAHKPQRHTAGETFSDGIASILIAIEENGRLKRPALAAKILGAQHDSPDFEPRKAALASDLHYLILAGHVIEFSEGALELPLPPKAAHAAASLEPEADMQAEAAASVAEPESAPVAAVQTEPEAHLQSDEQEQAAAPAAADPEPTPATPEATSQSVPVETQPAALTATFEAAAAEFAAKPVPSVPPQE